MAKMIDGTLSKNSYMVVAQDGKFVLAIRPYGIMSKLKKDGSKQSLVSIRFRVAPVEYGSERIIKLGSQEIEKAFPDLAHEKINQSRKSAQFTTPVPIGLEDPEQLEQHYATIIDSVFEAIEKLSGDHLLVDREQIEEFLTPFLNQSIGAVLASNIKEKIVDELYDKPGFHSMEIEKLVTEHLDKLPAKYKGLPDPVEEKPLEELEAISSPALPEEIGDGD